MPDIKLILSDIDGTIMPSGKHEVSPRTVAAFHRALDAGIVAGPASGRGFGQIPPFFGGDTACCATAIATNGLEVYHEGERICSQYLSIPALQHAIDIALDTPRAGVLVFDGTQPLLVAGEAEWLMRGAPSYARTCVKHDGLPDFPIIKANMFIDADEDGTAAFAERLNTEVSGLDFDIPMTGFMNIMPSGWNKGSAIEFLCKHLGIDLEEVVVFGDAGNDLTMFATVPNSVAVGNATPEAAAAARWHIGRCEDDAVAETIEALAAGAWPFNA